MNKKDYIKTANELKKAGRVALCIHMYPDGDAIGSMIALALCLKKLHKKVYLFSPTPLPRRYGFMPLYDTIMTRAPRGVKFDLAVSLDCATVVQLGDMKKNVFEKVRRTIEIDHHSSRRSFSDLSLVDDKAAAVGEMVYSLRKFLGAKMDSQIALCMLVSIIVETGSFRLPSVGPETFKICADLVSNGVDYYDIVEKSYWSRTRPQAMLLGMCFSRLKFFKDGRLAYSFVTFNDLKRMGAREEDVDPIADEIRTLKEVKVVLLLREMAGNKWRVSMRSKGKINVGRIAEEFGGGGHPDVAGCFLNRSSDDKNRLIKRIIGLI